MKRVRQLSSDANDDEQRHQRPPHQLRQRVHPIRLISLAILFHCASHTRLFLLRLTYPECCQASCASAITRQAPRVPACAPAAGRRLTADAIIAKVRLSAWLQRTTAVQ